MPLSRRDFLKLASLSPLLLSSDRLPAVARRPGDSGSGSPNIIVFVFDAFSAPHLSLYGYPRQTTPNIDRLAARASVFHAHYAAGSFTSSGTASLLTGTLPWTHRALQYSGLVARPLVQRNIFEAFGDARYKQAYAQNPWADNLLQQFRPGLDEVLNTTKYNLTDNLISRRLFLNDPIAAYTAVDLFALNPETLSGSSLFAALSELEIRIARSFYTSLYAQAYPFGLPTVLNGSLDIFTLEDLFNGLAESIVGLPESSALAYYHIYPPHFPVKPTSEFSGKFGDGWKPPEKPAHPLSEHLDPDAIDDERQRYDEYVASLDLKFGELMDNLERRGVLDNAYIVLTSDHGELHERGQVWHMNPLLYESVTRIPLLIFSPGQKTRMDFHGPTSCLDLLPTLLSISGRPVPDWAEGRLLPGFGGSERTAESVYTVDAKTESSFRPVRNVSISVVKGSDKLIYYNYPRYPQQYELYDLQDDPEELVNLYSVGDSVAQDMKDELQAMLTNANRPYEPLPAD